MYAPVISSRKQFVDAPTAEDWWNVMTAARTLVRKDESSDEPPTTPPFLVRWKPACHWSTWLLADDPKCPFTANFTKGSA
jgi:hypothetical protein